MPGFTVVSTMKNEGAFILDWVAHQKALGFDHLWVATNDCADNTVAILKRLEQLGLVRHHETRIWPRAGIQRSALKQCRWYDEVTKADWIFVCDVDEFLVVKTGDGSVQHLADSAGGHEVVSVAWRVFGPDGRTAYEDTPVTRQFLRAEADPRGQPVMGTYGKSLFRDLHNVQRIGIHGPVARPELGRDLTRCFAGGQPYVQMGHKIQIAPDFSRAQVNHYALRARDSFFVKRDRGRVNHANESMDFDYWLRFDRADEPCDAIRRYDAATEEWRDRLAADPELAQLHDEAVAWHRARIVALSARRDYQGLAAAIAARQG